MISIEDLRGAVARGWCSAENSHKEMDSTLAEAIVTEVHAALNAESQKPTTNTGSPKLPPVDEIIREVVGDRNSMHDVAVTAGINECYRIIARQLRAGA